MSKKIKILAVSSSGGHWIQLNRLRPFLSQYDTTYVSTDKSLKVTVSENFFGVRDASMWDKFGLLVQAFQILYVVLRVRPDIIISTGAAPGFFSLLIGKIFRKKTIWVDSIANADEMSLAGMKSKKFADIWLTQWPDLATDNGPIYRGQVL